MFHCSAEVAAITASADPKSKNLIYTALSALLKQKKIEIQAALAAAASFAVGAAMALLLTAIAPQGRLISLVSGTSRVFLLLLGGLAARADGAGGDGGRNPCHVLGCTGHGTDRRGRRAVRNSRVSGQTGARNAYIPPNRHWTGDEGRTYSRNGHESNS